MVVLCMLIIMLVKLSRAEVRIGFTLIELLVVIAVIALLLVRQGM